MLSSFRNFARSPFAALIIVPLLIVGFIFLDAQNAFNTSPNAAAVVGSQEVTARQLNRAYDQQLSAIQQQDPTFTRDQADQFGLPDQVLSNLIASASIDHVAEKMGLGVSDDTVREEIQSFPAFANAFTGNFDVSSYQSALFNAGYSRREFEAEYRNDLIRLQLTSSLLGNIVVPQTMARARLNYQQELRRMNALLIPPTLVGDLEDPGDEVLETFLNENSSFFQWPEQRRFTLVRLIAEDLVDDIDIDLQELRDTYDMRLETGQLADPATRTLRYWIAPSDEVARDAAIRANQGEVLTDVVAELELGRPITFNEVQEFQIPDDEVAEAAFSMISGDVSFTGNRLIAVDQSFDPDIPTFEEYQLELRMELAQSEVQNLILDQISALEEARAEGLPLSQAAGQVGIPVEKYDFIGANGYTVEGYPAESLLAFPSILENVFQLPAGIDTDPISVPGGGYFVVQVDEIQPAQTPSLAEVRDQVLEGWRIRTADEQLQAYVDDALARAEAGESLNEIAADIDSSVRVETATLRRSQTAGPFNAQLVGQAFTQPESTPFEARAGDMRTRAVVIVQDIVPADVPAIPPSVNTELENALLNDLSQVIQRAMVNKVSVRRNQTVIDQALGRTQIQQ